VTSGCLFFGSKPLIGALGMLALIAAGELVAWVLWKVGRKL
jgi:hypothetical protein